MEVLQVRFDVKFEIYRNTPTPGYITGNIKCMVWDLQLDLVVPTQPLHQVTYLVPIPLEMLLQFDHKLISQIRNKALHKLILKEQTNTTQHIC